jgi:hypothetical protein
VFHFEPEDFMAKTPAVESPLGDIPPVEVSKIEIPNVGTPEIKMPDVENSPAEKSAEKLADQVNESARSIREEVEVTGNQLLDTVKTMIAEGKVRRLILRTPDNKMVLEVPLVVGIVVGGALTLAAPFLTLIGAIGSVLAKVKVEVVRDKEPSV